MASKDTERAKYKRRKVDIEPMPTVVETAADRGKAFQHWLDTNDYFVSDFAKASKISRATLNLYLTGELDIASMRQDTAERLLQTMALSDTEAWEFFNIPEDRRSSFRTFRPVLGHGNELKKVFDMTLKVPLQGETTVNAGNVIRINPAKQLTGLVVAELEDGKLFALPAELARGRGRIIGQLIATFYTQPI